MDANGKRYDGQKDTRTPKERELKLMTEMYIQDVQGEPRPVVLLIINAEDYLTKKPVIQFGVDFKQVTEWYNYMKELDEEAGNSDSGE